MKSTFCYSVLLLLLVALFNFCTAPRGTGVKAIETHPNIDTWKTIDSLDKRGLFRSALPLATALLERSIEENNPAQAGKALRYKLKFSQEVEEDYEQNLWLELLKYIEKAAFPTKNMLAAVAAERLWSYYQINQWRLTQRQTSGSGGDDIREWSKRDFISTTADLYEVALSSPFELHQINWTAMTEMLVEDSVDCAEGTTLLDLLSRPAISFYLSYEVNVQSLEQVIADPEKLLADHATFRNVETKPVENAYWHKVVELYRTRGDLHLADENEIAIAEITIDRLQEFRKLEVSNHSDSIYIQTLESTKEAFNNPIAKAHISVALASFYEDRGDRQQTAAEDGYYEKAIQQCEEVLALEDCPDRLCKRCTALASRIEKMELNFVTEKIILPNEPWRSLINYRNLSECYYIVVPFNYEEYREITALPDREEQIVKISSSVRLRGLPHRVPFDDDGDYQRHGTWASNSVTNP